MRSLASLFLFKLAYAPNTTRPSITFQGLGLIHISFTMGLESVGVHAVCSGCTHAVGYICAVTHAMHKLEGALFGMMG